VRFPYGFTLGALSSSTPVMRSLPMLMLRWTRSPRPTARIGGRFSASLVIASLVAKLSIVSSGWVLVLIGSLGFDGISSLLTCPLVWRPTMRIAHHLCRAGTSAGTSARPCPSSLSAIASLTVFIVLFCVRFVRLSCARHCLSLARRPLRLCLFLVFVMYLVYAFVVEYNFLYSVTLHHQGRSL
jgi:hypothetical protein